jgi:tRNA G18 (ribose-2'-O)-methylase SpoU
MVCGMEWSSALSDPGLLQVRGLFLAEGRLVLQRILAGAAGGPDGIVAALATPPAAAALELRTHLGDRLVVRTPTEMESLTGFNFHRGVLALVRRPSPRQVDGLIRQAIGAPGPGAHAAAVIVVAEHLVDVDNIGSCFRNARAFGATAVLLDERCPDPLYRKSVRTSLGTVLEVPWTKAPMTQLLDGLAGAGVATVGLTPAATVSAKLTAVGTMIATDVPVALVVGNEGQGLSPETQARCTRLARIPMAEGADSLNVATALAVALYEWQVRRR